MRLARIFLSMILLIVPAALTGQEANRPSDPDLLARLSYDSSAIAPDDVVRHVCISVTRNREYSIERELHSGPMQRVHGRLQAGPFRRLKRLLASSEFQSLSGNHGGLIRQDAESFAAEIPMTPPDDRVQHLQWLNPDGEKPFPGSVALVVQWLKRFEPKNGKELSYAEFPDICPSGGLRFVQPSVATNEHP